MSNEFRDVFLGEGELVTNLILLLFDLISQLPNIVLNSLDPIHFALIKVCIDHLMINVKSYVLNSSGNLLQTLVCQAKFILVGRLLGLNTLSLTILRL